MMIGVGCSQERAVAPVDFESGTYETFDLYVASRVWHNSYPRYFNTKDDADQYCRNVGYQFATEYSGRRQNDLSDHTMYLNKVTCWKPSP